MNVDKIFFKHDELKIRELKKEVARNEGIDYSYLWTKPPSPVVQFVKFRWKHREEPVITTEVSQAKVKVKNPLKVKYYEEVWQITERNAPKVKNIHLRGQDYHIDHIVPISYGFKKGIKPSVIGGLKNLRIITRQENFKKNCQFVTL